MKRILSAFLVLVPLACGAVSNPAEPLPLEYFLAPQVYRLPKLSLDGRSYGIVVKKDDIEVITTVDLATGKATPISKSSEMEYVNYWWKSNSLLLLLLQDRNGDREFQTFNIQTQESNFPSTVNKYFVRLVNPLLDDPENVLVSTGTGTGLDLRKFNIKTGRSEPLRVDSNSMAEWVADPQGQPRAGVGVFHKRWFVIVPEGPDKPWRRIELGERNPPDFRPMLVARDRRHILAMQYGGADTASVVSWDPTSDSKEPVWQSAEVDPDYLGDWSYDGTFMNTIIYETDQPQLHYIDPDDQALARAIDTALPGTTNVILSTTPDRSKMIIQRSSDRVAGDFYLFDRQAKKLGKLGSAYAHSEPTRLGASRYFTSKTGDGLPLHGRIHLAASSNGPAPAVLWVGDLKARSRFSYRPYFQLLASRGFAVIEIDHRGVSGYGEKFAEAGNLAVGAAMADDLIDGLDFLAREGLIDAGRVAILGDNRGGLLAIQALARHPTRFSAWVNFATPMDPDKLDADELVFGRFSEDEIKARFGSETTRRKYQKTLDPLRWLPQLKQPAFHYYPRRYRSSNELVRDGDRLADYFGKAGQPAVFFKGKVVRDETEYLKHKDAETSAELKQVYTELIQFLDSSLGVKR